MPIYRRLRCLLSHFEPTLYSTLYRHRTCRVLLLLLLLPLPLLLSCRCQARDYSRVRNPLACCCCCSTHPGKIRASSQLHSFTTPRCATYNPSPAFNISASCILSFPRPCKSTATATEGGGNRSDKAWIHGGSLRRVTRLDSIRPLLSFQIGFMARPADNYPRHERGTWLSCIEHCSTLLPMLPMLHARPSPSRSREQMAGDSARWRSSRLADPFVPHERLSVQNRTGGLIQRKATLAVHSTPLLPPSEPFNYHFRSRDRCPVVVGPLI